MNYTALNAEELRNMLMAGAAALGRHKEEVNSLNVFPVPDGDTGTNMNLTVEAANREMAKHKSATIKQISDALSMGSLMGARGNSGVILSQIFRGLAKGLSEAESITPHVLAIALQMGVDTAYKAVIKPVEGTILTVAKGAARAAAKYSRAEDLNTMMEQVLLEAQHTLDRTPEYLPVLKQAGVVDAGGKGLCYIFEGWMDYLAGRSIEETLVPAADAPAAVEAIDAADLEFSYCTEFLVTGEDLNEDVFRRELCNHGNSLVVVGTSGLIKIHIHTNNPGLVLDFALSQGKELQDIKIDNMRYQHRETLTNPQADAPQAEAKLNGVITVAAGAGMEEIFKSMGADYVVRGGQTMNPSTEDFLQAIEEINAQRIIILPNNKNILMAAKQAAEVANKPVVVIPTKTIPQGLTALLNYSADEENLDRLEAAMQEGLAKVKTGQVTYAVRDSVFDGQPIAEGNILGIADGKIVTVTEDIDETTLNLVAEMVDEESELITLFYGEDMESEAAEKIAASLEKEYPDHEVELHPGGQPLYYFIIAIE
ncbi:MAG: DAK2 domain-containing protein [Eubacteriales bacterium]|nr:DAK2 domain-containing protein [Eubacteriales bacterium]